MANGEEKKKKKTTLSAVSFLYTPKIPSQHVKQYESSTEFVL